jgi:hypothetical protein
MSTRGLLVFIEGNSGKSIYKCMDSDPQCALNYIKDYLFPNPSERFVLGEVRLKDIIPLEDDEIDLEVKGNLLNDWGGTPNMQWVYIVNMTKKEIKVYGNEYGSYLELINRGIVNPVDSITSYYPEYQDSYKKVILELMDYLTFQGYLINPQEDLYEDNNCFIDAVIL